MIRFIIGKQYFGIMREKTRIRPKYMLLIVLSTLLFSVVFYFLGKNLADSPLSYKQYLEFTVLISIVIVGGYQLFFWIQKNNYYFKTRCLKTKLDDMIPFWPGWIWIYSFIYYILIGYIVVSIQSIEEGVHIIFGGIVLLAAQCIFFILFPCTVLPRWRKYKVDSLSMRFLRFTQGLDNGRNCMPSMHMSVATFVSLLLLPVLGYYAYIFILLIALSCLFVKQHQIFDILPGILLGWIVYVLVI